MKFEFCGKLDCPDWILAQLFAASKLDLVRFEIICESVKETILRDGQLEEPDFFGKLNLDEEEFDLDDARACFGALNYIMTSACLYQTSSNLLSIELEQLGLPLEHTGILCRILDNSFDSIREHL